MNSLRVACIMCSCVCNGRDKKIFLCDTELNITVFGSLLSYETYSMVLMFLLRNEEAMI